MSDETIMDIEILDREMELEDDSDDTLKNVAVVGAGIMGQGISILAASKGLDVILIETSKAEAERSLKEMEAYIDSEIAKANAAEIERLSQELEAASAENDRLHYMVGGLGDAARMNCAMSVVPAMLDRYDDLGEALEQAIDMADALVTRYSDIIAEKQIEYQRLVALQNSNGGEKEN